MNIDYLTTTADFLAAVIIAGVVSITGLTTGIVLLAFIIRWLQRRNTAPKAVQ